MDFPKTGTLYAQNLAVYESKINQSTPTSDKSFLKVQAAIDELNEIGQSKLQANLVLQNFVKTAQDIYLDEIGSNFEVNRKLATQARVVINVSAASGTVIPLNTGFLGSLNRLTYNSYSAASATGSPGNAPVSVICTVAGSDGNLQVADTLEIQSSIAGLTLTTATVSEVLETATDKESDDDYRIRILDKMRSPGDGGTPSFYRNAGQEVTGVARIYPYAGSDTPLTSLPGEVVCYVRATTDVNADGIAPADILTEVKATIITDPVTGLRRRDLGLPDSLLYVLSISRLTVYTQIRGLNITGTISEADLKSQIDAAITSHLSNLECFCVGLDSNAERNDMITVGGLYATINPILATNGATITGIDFRFSTTGAFQNSYSLAPGELAKNSGVSYT